MRQSPVIKRVRTLWSIPIVLASAVGALYGPSVAQAAPLTTGSLEVCKSSNNGMLNRPFLFTVDSGAQFQVLGGGCSHPLSVSTGNHAVAEAQDGTTVVTKISSSPSGTLKSSSLAAGTATVSVAANTETIVTYTNKTPAAQVKVCKQAADDASQLVGQPFSFTISGHSSAFTINAGPFGSPNCSGLFTYQAGTNITTTELQPQPNVFVSSIDVTSPPATNVNTDLNARTATFTAGSGVTVVTYTNEISIPSTPGFVEICKAAGDRFVSATFVFSILDSAGNTFGPIDISVSPGNSPVCSGPIQVNSGTASITEAQQAPYSLSDVTTWPSDRLIDRNLVNQTADVNVVAGDSSNETLVTFTNSTQEGLVKVCKTLSTGSGALTGTSFSFAWSATFTAPDGSVFNFMSGPVSIVAPAPGQTACKFLNSGESSGGFPLGTVINIQESPQDNVQLTGVSVSPSSNDLGSSPTSGANLTVGPGITAATFTNAALGTLEICKTAGDSQTANAGDFYFLINHTITVHFPAGQCSLPLSVPVGTATIFEQAKANYHFDFVTATGPDNSSRITGNSNGFSNSNPVTVDVPFGGVGNETLVTFYNSVNTGTWKICKTSSNSADQNTTFTFTSFATVNGSNSQVFTDNLKPGQCSGSHPGFFFGGIPVVNDNQTPVVVTTSEAGSDDVYVASIRYQGNGHQNSTSTTGPGSVDQGGSENFNIGQGQNVVTYDNEVFIDND